MSVQQGRWGVAARVEQRLDRIARAMLDTIVAQLPDYARLPSQELADDILEICRENLRIFFRCLREERPPSQEELAEPCASAARRAEEGVPLESVLTAYHLGGRLAWRAMIDEAAPGERDELIRLAGRIMAYLQTVTSAVAAAYLEEQQQVYGEQRDARRALAEALLHGEPQQGALSGQAARAGIRLANGYLVAAVQISPRGDELADRPAAAVDERRRIRRVQEQCDVMAGEPVLTLLDASGGLVLFPADGEHAEQTLARAGDLVGSLAAAAGSPIRAGVAWRPGGERVAEAAAEASEVLRLALRLGRGPGAYRLDDVLLEHLLTHPSDSSERLIRLLDPLARRPDLLETLERWYDADFDRRAAAAALSIHPNTLDYRLRRIRDLTGIDTATAKGLQLVGAALTVRQLRGE